MAIIPCNYCGHLLQRFDARYADKRPDGVRYYHQSCWKEYQRELERKIATVEAGIHVDIGGMP